MVLCRRYRAYREVRARRVGLRVNARGLQRCSMRRAGGVVNDRTPLPVSSQSHELSPAPASARMSVDAVGAWAYQTLRGPSPFSRGSDGRHRLVVRD